MERIGKECFCESGLAEIEIPKTLKVIGTDAFKRCTNLFAIRVDDACECCLSNTEIPSSAGIFLLREVFVSDRHLFALRGLNEVTIPEGIGTIGSYWFWGSSVESVTISSDIRRIGIEAFCNCKALRNLVFRNAKAKRNFLMTILDYSAS